YDEVTDLILRRFYRVEPSHYLALSATLWLPLPRAGVTAEDCERLARRTRDLHYNPERHLPPDTQDSNLQELLAEKERWVGQTPQTPEARKRRFLAIRELSGRLRPSLGHRIDEARSEATACAARLKTDALLSRRDF